MLLNPNDHNLFDVALRRYDVAIELTPRNSAAFLYLLQIVEAGLDSLVLTSFVDLDGDENARRLYLTFETRDASGSASRDDQVNLYVDLSDADAEVVELIEAYKNCIAAEPTADQYSLRLVSSKTCMRCEKPLTTLNELWWEVCIDCAAMC